MYTQTPNAEENVTSTLPQLFGSAVTMLPFRGGVWGGDWFVKIFQKVASVKAISPVTAKMQVFPAERCNTASSVITGASVSIELALSSP